MIRVAIADDHPLVRKGLAQLVGESGDMQVVAEAGDYAPLARALREHPADVLLLDLDLPGKNGLEILRFVRGEHSGLKVLIYSMHPEEHYGLRALKAGAAGYLNKALAPQTVLAAIRLAARGGKYITPELAQALAEQVAGSAPENRPPHENLSDREFQTLRLIAAGKKLSEIAAALSLSPKTVSVYRMRLTEKLGAHTTAELTRYAIEHKLVE